VVLNIGAPAAFTVAVLTSGNAMAAPNITSRRSSPAPVLPGAFAAALNVLFFILVLRFYREWGGLPRANGSNASRWKIAYAVAALLIFIPLIFAANGCGGAATNAPAAQKSSIVTPSGTSILVITPTATNASGKAL
jgi:hypothetical protein